MFVADDPLTPSWRFCLRDIDTVILKRGDVTRAERSARGTGPVLEIFLGDTHVSELHAVLSRAGDGWILVDKGSKNGTRRNHRSVAQAALADGDIIEIGDCFLLFREALPLLDEDARTATRAPENSGEFYPTTLLPDLASEISDLRAAAREQAPVLILGETGTGKEGAARAVHTWSERPGAFIPVNCGGIPRSLVESELFGSVRGAFSGAANRTGIVRMAHRGTLLLDEIGDLPLEAQTALLRFLQEGELWPVGAPRPVSVDVRIISATHHDLAAMVREGRFRRDLYARIAGFTVSLPPVRERRADFGLFIAALLRHYAAAQAARVTFHRRAVRALLQYDWPCNLRELRYCLSGAITFARGGPITLDHLPDELRELEARSFNVTRTTAQPRDMITAERRRRQLVVLLGDHSGNISAVAREMGCSRARVYRWLQEYGIERGRLPNENC